MTRTHRFALSDLKDGEARTFRREGNPWWFAVRQGDRVYAYVDRCPHTNRTALAWRDGAYLDGPKRYIRCAAHNALFDIATGRGVAGPCLGDRLTPLPVSIDHGEVAVDLSEALSYSTAR